MHLPVVIHWTADPVLFEFGALSIRWYGILFASGFAVGYMVTQRIFKRENLPIAWLDPLLFYLILGGVIGARLGHVFFYDWSDFQNKLWEIPMIWRGGLASHGGAIGVLIAFWAFSRYVSKQPMLWIMDRCAPAGAIGAMFIRLGNLMNHEIVGQPSDLPWAFVFYEQPVRIPLHPTQLYEAIAYLFIFLILWYSYRQIGASKYPGMMTGLYLVFIFSARFLLEFTKKTQAAFTEDWPINMGQTLSIPLILMGLGFILHALIKKSSLSENNLSPS